MGSTLSMLHPASCCLIQGLPNATLKPYPICFTVLPYTAKTLRLNPREG